MTARKRPQQRRQAATRKGMRQINAAVPFSMHRKLMVTALRTNTAATQIVRDALDHWLSRKAS